MKNLFGSMILITTIINGTVHAKVTGACDASSYDLPEGIQIPPQYGNQHITLYILLASSITTGSRKYETPLAIRAFSLIEAAGWNCIAAYDKLKHDALRPGQRPVVEVPETPCNDMINVHTTGARAQCYAYMYGAVLPNLLPESVEGFQEAMELLSTDFTGTPPIYTGAYPRPFPMGIDTGVLTCGEEVDYEDFKECVNVIAADNNYVPSVIASIIAQDMLWYAKNDGFNMDGTNQGQCENNCRPYSDTTGYQPKNLLYSVDVEKKKKRIKKSKKTKKYISKDRKYWQPLLEDNGNGFFYRQEHVTPHIGTKAKPRILTRKEIDSRKLNSPKYDLLLESDIVVDRLRDLDDKKKMEIEFFDDKTNIVGAITGSVFFRYFTTMTFEQTIFLSMLYTASEFDAVILAWKEKVRHNLVRPTTVIQRSDLYGTPGEINTWGGPFRDVETFPSKDFQPYIRVMPHAEYPSATGCICQASMSVVKVYMKVVHSDDGEGFSIRTAYKAGSSKIEPGLTPGDDITEFYTLEQFKESCGQSRLDGGMHFTAAVENSYELCRGFEEATEQRILELLNGSDDMLDVYTPGVGPPF